MTNINNIIQQVKDAIQENLKSYIGAKNTVDTRAQISKNLFQQYAQAGRSVIEKEIQFEQDPQDSYAIIPSNLYTLILTKGLYVDYEKVKDKTSYLVPQNELYLGGCTLTFYLHSSTYGIKFNRRLKLEVHINEI